MQPIIASTSTPCVLSGVDRSRITLIQYKTEDAKILAMARWWDIPIVGGWRRRCVSSCDVVVHEQLGEAIWRL